MEDISKKIILPNDLPKYTRQFSQKKQTAVIAGGCFDIIHTGHIAFLQQAKKQGDHLIILLESDESIKKKKGVQRPINTQHDRAVVLSAICFVDYICVLKPFMTDADYDDLVIMIKPAIIATTKGDSFRYHKERQANMIGGIVKDVTQHIPDKSTTALFTVLETKKI